MKKCLALLLSVVLIVLSAAPISASAAYALDSTVSISATSAYVVFLGPDSKQDTLLYERNPDQRIAPAGLVRIMVGLYALKILEENAIDPAVATATYSEEAADQTWDTLAGTGLPNIGLNVGDVWHLNDLLTVCLINSGGDALTLMMNSLAGSHENFVNGMNELAAALGCTNTHFQNAYGLDDAQQYSSARDIYRIFRYASLNYPAITAILGQTDHTVNPVIGEKILCPSTNQLLRRHEGYYYNGILYGRSGFTSSTGPSCASVARVNGLEVMTIVMGCQQVTDNNSAAFTDSASLYDWAKNSFSYETVLRKNQPLTRVGVDLAWSTDAVVLVAQNSFVSILHKNTNIANLQYEIVLNTALFNADGRLTAPVSQDTVYGTAKIFDNGVLIGEVGLVPAETVPRSQLLAIGNAVWIILTSPFVLITLAVLLTLFVAYVIISVIHNNSRRKKNRKRVKRYR